MATIADRLYNYLIVLANNGRIYSHEEAARFLGCKPSSVSTSLTTLQSRGFVQIEARHLRDGLHRRVVSVTVRETGKSTAWPECDAKPIESAADRLEALRLAAQQREAERAAYERHWLEKERAPRRRELPADTFFIDRETARALNGGYA